MKKLFLLLLALPLLFISCRDDDDDVDYSKDIVGTWVGSHFNKFTIETNNKEYNKGFNRTMAELIKSNDFSKMGIKSQMSFYDNGKWESIDNGIKEEGIYKLSGRMLTTTPTDNPSNAITAKIDLNKNTLILAMTMTQKQLDANLEELGELIPGFKDMMDDYKNNNIIIHKMSGELEYIRK